MQAELEQLRNAIARFDMVDLGYPKSAHVIRDQSNPAAALKMARDLGVPKCSGFADFYAIADGVSLPDVEAGYRLYTLEEIGMINAMDSEPSAMGGRAISIVGSDGGGARFALAHDTGEVYLLPMARVSAQREYGGEPRLVASGVGALIAFLAQKTIAACLGPPAPEA